MNVIVVGGGAVGLSVAASLHRRDASVTVIDAGAFGAGASAGNAGWITPVLCEPLPAPGTARQAMRWMLDRGSPFHIHPTFRPALVRWTLDFLRSTSRRRYASGLAALAGLAERTIADFERLGDAGVEFEMHRDGLLFLATDAATLDRERHMLAGQQAFGYRGDIEFVERAELSGLQPQIGPDVIGGIYAAGECHVRPEGFTAALVTYLRNVGVTLREHAEVAEVAPDGDGWQVSLEPRTERLRADRVVLAMGTATGRLLEPLGVALPLEGAKGYSVTMDAPDRTVRRPLYLVEAKVAISPYAGVLRFAGTLELGAEHDGVDERRVQAVEDAAARYLGTNGSRGPGKRWAGFRPTLPDGLPAIGPVPGREGLFVATGHATMGITLAPTTGEVLAPAVCGERSGAELAPFSVARFGNLGPDGDVPTLSQRPTHMEAAP